MRHFVGADENGLGAMLGPLVVTGVLARADGLGERVLARRPPRWLSPDLDDSKRVVSHADVKLGEAWARVLGGRDAATPDDLVDRIALETRGELTRICPTHVGAQCWSSGGEAFHAPDDLVARIAGHRARLAERGVEIVAVRSSIVCTKRLNDALLGGANRFVSDLHAMERLVIAFRERAKEDLVAVCGKVGGMGDYDRFFGPLAGWLRVTLEAGRARSAYRFPGLGEMHFVRDADARHPLVMLASLVGKWVRELLMARVGRWYEVPSDAADPSGYHDPVTQRFVAATTLVRRGRGVPSACFERLSEARVV